MCCQHKVLVSVLCPSLHPQDRVSWHCRHSPQILCASSEISDISLLLETEKYIISYKYFAVIYIVFSGKKVQKRVMTGEKNIYF